MINKDVLTMALAAFIHDVGKFSQRAQKEIPESFKRDNQNLFQPSINGHYSCIHALYSAYFISELEKQIPCIFKNEIDGISLLNLACAHHKPNNPLEWIICIADRLSSGMDGKESLTDKVEFDHKDKDFNNTKMISVFEEIGGDLSLNDKHYSDYKYHYPLKPMSPQTIFPINAGDAGDYKTLFEEFLQNVEKISHKNNLKLWFEHFDTLFQIYCSCVPATSVSDYNPKNIPDVSLYDHARTTSAIASALYIYHKSTKTLNEIAIKNETDEKFIYLKTKFYSIQNFIFAQGGQTNKKSAKILRGRSFYISLLMELAADMLCENIGVSHSSIIMNAAGGVSAILPNTPHTIEQIENTQNQINEWLIKHFYGEVSIGFAFVKANAIKFKTGIKELGQDIAIALEKKKFQKIDLKHFGVVDNYFANDEVPCAYCGKRPAKDNDDKDKVQCPICKDLTMLGEKLVKENKIIILDKDKGDLGTLIFDKYGLLFDKDDTKNNLYLSDNPPADLIRYWDLSIEYIANIRTTLKTFSAYVPQKEDGSNEVKDFEAIATSQENCGTSALGILKCDVDNLGELFENRICAKHGDSISKHATFSRQMNSFFTIYLPSLLMSGQDFKFKNVYTLFAGGDDLFLIGHWDTIIDLAFYVREEFRRYCCNNNEITFSTGITMAKQGEMIMSFYRNSEHALELSKNKRNEQGKIVKDSLTIFDETISWSYENKFKEIDNKFIALISGDKINNAAIYKILAFIEMAKQEDKIKEMKKSCGIKDMQNLKWRSLLVYFISRNYKLSKEEGIIEYLTKLISDKDLRSVLKIVLWKNIYKNR
jgi:CRISPR-associated protein Csm1